MVLKLYYFKFSSPCRFALAVCRELGLDVKVEVVSLQHGEHKKPEYLKICPDSVVPCLDDDGFTLTESRAIAAYLCEKYGGDDCSLYPRDPQKRALINRWLWTDSTVYSDLLKYFAPIIVYKKKPEPEVAQKAEERLDKMEKQLEKSDFLCGASWTLPDLSFANALLQMELVGFDLSKWPKASSLLEKYKAKSYFEALPDVLAKK